MRRPACRRWCCCCWLRVTCSYPLSWCHELIVWVKTHSIWDSPPLSAVCCVFSSFYPSTTNESVVS